MVRPVLICQRTAALQLLRRKYSVSPRRDPSPSVDQEWQAWVAVLGKAPPGLRESFFVMRVTLACGLAELTALYLCPNLLNRFFGTMCSTLLLAGAIQTISFARHRNEPIRQALTRLASIVQELAELSPPAVAKEASGGPILTLQGNDNAIQAEGVLSGSASRAATFSMRISTRRSSELSAIWAALASKETSKVSPPGMETV